MGNDLSLRRWQESDCRMLYDWRMHEANRRWFGNDAEFPFSEHQQWFLSAINDSERFLYILEDAGEAVAQIRLDPAELAGSFRIAVATDPEKSGRGYGQMILRLAVQQPEVIKRANLLIAETLIDNIPSQKIFARQGFLSAGSLQKSQKKFLCWVLPLDSSGPLPVRLYCDEKINGRLEDIMTRTGLGLSDSDQAKVKVLFDLASDENIGADSLAFHINTDSGEILLDLAYGGNFELKLPVAFGNIEMALLQIICFLKKWEKKDE